MSMTSEEMIRQLQEIFPNRSISSIQYVMDVVNQENPTDEDDYKFETAFNLLTDTGTEDELHDEAVGGENVKPPPPSNLIFNEDSISVGLENLIQIFPDCPLSYLKELLMKRGPSNFDDIVDELSSSEQMI